MLLVKFEAIFPFNGFQPPGLPFGFEFNVLITVLRSYIQEQCFYLVDSVAMPAFMHALKE